jgi:hypothetical protein
MSLIPWIELIVRSRPDRYPLAYAIQNGLEASKSAVQRDIPISFKHLSSRLSSSYRERAKCHHSAIRRFTSFQRVLRWE